MSARKFRKSWWVDFRVDGRRYRFKSPDELCCVDMDLHLDVGSTVTLDSAGGRPVALPPLMFGPSCDI